MLVKKLKDIESHILEIIITFLLLEQTQWDICVNISPKHHYKKYLYASQIHTLRLKIIVAESSILAISVNMHIYSNQEQDCTALLMCLNFMNGIWNIWENIKCLLRLRMIMIHVFKLWLIRLKRDKKLKEIQEASIGLFLKELKKNE